MRVPASAYAEADRAVDNMELWRVVRDHPNPTVETEVLSLPKEEDYVQEPEA